MPPNDSIDAFLNEWKTQRPELEVWPLGVMGRIARLSSHFLKQTENWLAPLGLTWETFSVIVALRRSGEPYELSPSQLIKQSLLTSGAITNRIDRVEAMGLVERRPNPTDRRGARICLTASGISLADLAIQVHLEASAEYVGVISRTQNDELSALLRHFLRGVENKA